VTAREQLLRACRQNRDLTRENGRLRDELRRTDRECQELVEANANLRVERDATDVLLGAAMDELLAGSGSPKGRS
jgi:hypothetical protein